MMGFLNQGSLMLGLIAWLLPIIALTQYEKNKRRNWVVLSIMSMSACAISLCFQIIYNYHLVKIEDWSALLDTTDAVVFAAIVLLIGTILLNIICLMRFSGKARKES